jgi:DNA-binding MarR family transcriptional regulator
MCSTTVEECDVNPDEFNIEDSFGYSLHHASYIFKASLKDRFQTAGINVTPEEFVFLFLIPEEGATQNLLTRKSLKDKTTITRLVDRLVSKGWINRVENDQNRREQVINTTKAGRRIKQSLMQIAGEFVADVTKGISAKEIEQSRKTLNQITMNLMA